MYFSMTLHICHILCHIYFDKRSNGIKRANNIFRAARCVQIKRKKAALKGRNEDGRMRDDKGGKGGGKRKTKTKKKKKKSRRKLIIPI
jgi:hypothetical protein